MELEIERWNELSHRLMAFVRKRVADKENAKDIVQDVFLQFHGHRHQLRDSDKLVAWIFRIAQNKISDFYRYRIRQADAPVPTQDEENRYTRCVATCLKQELAKLPDKYREALELAEMNTIPQVKIASAFGLSYSGLKSRVQRARDPTSDQDEDKVSHQVRPLRKYSFLRVTKRCFMSRTSRVSRQSGPPLRDFVLAAPGYSSATTGVAAATAGII